MRLLLLLLVLAATSVQGQLSPSKVVATDASNHLTAYAGTSPGACSNQFLRQWTLSAAGVGSASCATVSLTSDVTGTLPFSNGGFGFTTAAVGDIFYASALNTPGKLTIGAAGRWLGSSGTLPQWNAPAALTKADDTNVTLTLGGSPSTALLNAASITAGWSGQLSLARGGTAVNNASASSGTFLRGNGAGFATSTLTLPNTLSSGDVVYASSANTGAGLAIGSAGQILRSTGSLPAWSTTTWPNSATSGGVLYASGANTWATSAALGSGQVVLGGGAGAAPNTTSNFSYTDPTAFITKTTNATTNELLRLTNSGAGNLTGGKIAWRNGSTEHASIAAYYNGAWILDLNAIDRLTVNINGTGAMGISSSGITAGSGVGASARMYLVAGTIAAGTAPLKFTSGPVLTTPEVGAVEFTSDKWFGTISTGTARKEFTLNDAALTSGRVPIVTTNGRLTDDSDMTFATDTLTVTKASTTQVSLSGATSGAVVVKAAAVAGSNTVTLPAGTTDFSATGGTSQVVKQTSSGGAFTVGQLAMADVSDYSTGTFTPAVTFGGGSTGVTYTNQVGRYTQIGNRVAFSLRMTLSAKGSSTGTAHIEGLPFTTSSASNSFTACSVYGTNFSASTNSLTGLTGIGVSYLSLVTFAAGTRTVMDDTYFTDTSDMVISCVYEK